MAKDVVGLRPGVAASAEEQTILFVRHAQGEHNVYPRTLANWHEVAHEERFRDCPLTAEGVAQAQAFARATDFRPDLVVASPLSRCLDTALRAFDARPVLAHELARERIANHASDRRSTRASLAKKFGGGTVDLSLLEDDDDLLWAHKEDDPTPDESTRCTERARDLLRFLRARPERAIAVVSHGVFLRHLFGLFPDYPHLAKPFAQCESRAVALFLLVEETPTSSSSS